MNCGFIPKGFCTRAPPAREVVMEMVRQEVEKCDLFGGFLTIMSLAGGTGSGVGTYMTQCLRDEYPHSFIFNQVVTPYRSGEVSVQNYNAVLTLAHLYQSVDSILMVENDHAHRICTHRLNMKDVSFKQINSVIAHQMSSVLLPVYSASSRTHLVHNQLGLSCVYLNIFASKFCVLTCNSYRSLKCLKVLEIHYCFFKALKSLKNSCFLVKVLKSP